MKRSPLLQTLVSGCILILACDQPVTEVPKPSSAKSKATLIKCHYNGNEGLPEIANAKQGTYHYRLHLPTDYESEVTRKYPCIFISSPGGNARMGALSSRIRRDQWIAIMLTEARNGPWDINLGNFLAAHDHVMEQYRCDSNRKYATGISGGARGSAVYTMLRPGFAGLWLQAAGLPSAITKFRPLSQNLSIYATFGDKDFNLSELDDLKHLPHPFAYEIFPGGHVAAPFPVAERAFDWFAKRHSMATGLDQN